MGGVIDVVLFIISHKTKHADVHVLILVSLEVSTQVKVNDSAEFIFKKTTYRVNIQYDWSKKTQGHDVDNGVVYMPEALYRLMKVKFHIIYGTHICKTHTYHNEVTGKIVLTHIYLNLLNFLNVVIHLPFFFFALSIIILRDIEVGKPV